MEKSGKQTQRHEGHRIHGRHRRARHNQSDQQHQDTPEQRNDLRELLCGCVWTQKRQFDCQTAEPPLVPFCGEEGGRCFVVRSKPQTTWIARRGRRAPRDVVSFWKTLIESVAWADMGPSTRAHSISCNTLPDSVLSDERFGRETWSNDSVVAWTDGACVCRGSEERAVEYSLVSTTTEIAPSPCLGVSRRTIVRNSAMQVHEGNLEIRSDSEYVRIATGRTRGETQKRQRGPC